MKKILLGAALVAAFMMVGAGSAKAELVTSTTSLSGATLKASQSNGTIVEACVVNTYAAANTFHFYDGTTLKFSISVATGTSFTLNFAELLKEQWVVSGNFIVKAKVEDADGRVTCSVWQKRAN
jgi:opacity protein-like surface antigen